MNRGTHGVACPCAPTSAAGRAGGVPSDDVHAARRSTVILLGDSIRMGYQPHVRRELGDAFDVNGRAENCATSRNLLANLDRWALAAPASVIHLNAGLHDLRYDPGRDAPVVSIGEYESNVRAILGRLRERSDARLIWATTTPVHEKLHAEQKLSRRRESDVTSYNDIATAIARDLGVEIDDPCAAVLARGADALWSQDGVHLGAVHARGAKRSARRASAGQTLLSRQAEDLARFRVRSSTVMSCLAFDRCS